MSKTEHRTFLLTLDAEDGDVIANDAGFTPASEDVYDRERIQVMKDWATLEAEGVLPHVIRYARWFADVAYSDTMDDHEREMAVNAAVTFAGATIARLKNKGLLVTPEAHKVVAIAHDGAGNIVGDDRIPPELLDHAAEMFTWRHGEEKELDDE